MNQFQFPVMCDVCGGDGAGTMRTAIVAWSAGKKKRHVDPQVCADELRRKRGLLLKREQELDKRKMEEINDPLPQHPFVIHCSPGDPWYITFKDKEEIERFLPRRKKLFGKWKPGNCPKVPKGVSRHRSDVFSGVDRGKWTPDDALNAFAAKYPTPQHYLDHINNS